MRITSHDSWTLSNVIVGSLQLYAYRAGVDTNKFALSLSWLQKASNYTYYVFNLILGDVKDDQDSDHEEEHRTTEVKELAKSKWSSDLDEDDTQTNKDATKNLNALSGLIQSYSKERKSVRWGDQVTFTCFG